MMESGLTIGAAVVMVIVAPVSPARRRRPRQSRSATFWLPMVPGWIMPAVLQRRRDL
jgi:uncharacterized protein YgiB involved in biofilm formation